MKKILITLLMVSVTLVVTDTFGQQVILAGSDLWSTPGGGQTTHSFANSPIPAGFFGEGSAAFDGTVVLEGLPFQDNPGLAPQGSNNLGNADTIVQRLEDMSLQQTGDTASTPIEIVALSLTSVDPINVTVNGQEEMFNVEVQLPFGGQQPQGEMQINHNTSEGGTFNAVLPVNADMFFSNANTNVFVGGLNRPFEIRQTNQPWLLGPVSQEGSELVVITDPVQMGPGNTAVAPATSPNFFPGFLLQPRRGGAPKCVLTSIDTTPELATALSVAYEGWGRTPAFETRGPDADGDGVPDVCDNCPNIFNPFQEDANRDAFGDTCAQKAQKIYVQWGDTPALKTAIETLNATPGAGSVVFGDLSGGSVPKVWPLAENASIPIEDETTLTTNGGLGPANGFFMENSPGDPLFTVKNGGKLGIDKLGLHNAPVATELGGQLWVKDAVFRTDGAAPTFLNHGGTARWANVTMLRDCTQGFAVGIDQHGGRTEISNSSLFDTPGCPGSIVNCQGGEFHSDHSVIGGATSAACSFDATDTSFAFDLWNRATAFSIPPFEESNFSQKVTSSGTVEGLCIEAGISSFTSLGYNIDTDGSCFLDQATDLPNTDPNVTVDANNVPQPNPGSPLIESGRVTFVDNTLPCDYKDLNGLGRPQDFDLDGVFTCDRGPVEVQGGPDIGAPQTASYSATGRGGEGSFVEVLSDGRAVVSFYTYSLDGTRLLWFMGLGRVVGNSIVIDEMQRVTGGVFGAGFDEASIVRTNVGGMSMVFPECDGTANPGRLNFTARSDSGLEHLLNDANRLTFVVNCDGTKGANAQRSGAFFALGRSGEGIFVQWLSDGRVVLVFYTFDAAGNPFWTTSDIGNTAVNGNTVTANMLYAQGKTKFGANFDPAEVTMAPWGTITLTYTDDDSINFAHNSVVAGFTPGNHAYVRITQPLGTKAVAQGN